MERKSIILKWKCDAKFLWKITLNLSFIPRCKGCNFCEQADGIIARHAPRLTMNFWLTGLVWLWNESANKTSFWINWVILVFFAKKVPNCFVIKCQHSRLNNCKTRILKVTMNFWLTGLVRVWNESAIKSIYFKTFLKIK